jgi:hypothetical protein
MPRGIAVTAGSGSGDAVQAGLFQIASPVEATKDRPVGSLGLARQHIKKIKGSGTPTDA